MTDLTERPGSPEWEALCRRCGRCCYEKVDYQGEIFLTPTPCRFLNLDTCECTVYARREQCQDGCVVLNGEIVAMGVLPEGCPYRRFAPQAPLPRGYHALPEEIRLQLEEDE